MQHQLALTDALLLFQHIVREFVSSLGLATLYTNLGPFLLRGMAAEFETAEPLSVDRVDRVLNERRE